MLPATPPESLLREWAFGAIENARADAPEHIRRLAACGADALHVPMRSGDGRNITLMDYVRQQIDALENPQGKGALLRAYLWGKSRLANLRQAEAVLKEHGVTPYKECRQPVCEGPQRRDDWAQSLQADNARTRDASGPAL